MPMHLETRTIVQHGGHNGVCPDCPDTCDTCDGEGFVTIVYRPYVTFTHDSHLARDVVMGATWTHILIPRNQDKEIACPICGGEGSVC